MKQKMTRLDFVKVANYFATNKERIESGPNTTMATVRGELAALTGVEYSENYIRRLGKECDVSIPYRDDEKGSLVSRLFHRIETVEKQALQLMSALETRINTLNTRLEEQQQRISRMQKLIDEQKDKLAILGNSRHVPIIK